MTIKKISPQSPATSSRFAPFANESDVITMGELTIENHEGYIALVGQWNIERTKPGLKAARALLDTMQRAVDVMNEDAAAGRLPDELPPALATGSTENPFN